MSNSKITISFKLPDGTVQDVEASLGQSVMQAAIFNNVEGIEAECGGSCMCATCHVYLPSSLSDILPQPTEDEQEMLEETAAEQRAGSRLSCQLVVTESMEGQVFEVPECQS